MATLREFLTAFFDDIQISVYLRRQDQVALSLYSTRLKSGETETRILPRTHAGDPYFNYDRSLALWEDAFGRANIHVRLFDRKGLIGGSIVSDFIAVGSSARSRTSPPSPTRTNPSSPSRRNISAA